MKHAHGHKHMMHILDGDHEASVKHRGEAKVGVGGLAPVGHPSSDTRAEVFKKGGHVKKHHGK